MDEHEERKIKRLMRVGTVLRFLNIMIAAGIAMVLGHELHGSTRALPWTLFAMLFLWMGVSRMWEGRWSILKSWRESNDNFKGALDRMADTAKSAVSEMAAHAQAAVSVAGTFAAAASAKKHDEKPKKHDEKPN